jgi:hypothetical protein
MSKLVIIRGNSGSGKTTAAKALQHKLGRNIMLISQDVVRRDMLNVKDGIETLALPLLKELLTYGKNNCEIVVLEGILNSTWYHALFEFAMELFDNSVCAYYYNLPFEETLLRHQTKRNKDDFGENDMKKWWNEKDLINFIPEKMISTDMSLIDTVEMIYKDVMK